MNQLKPRFMVLISPITLAVALPALKIATDHHVRWAWALYPSHHH